MEIKIRNRPYSFFNNMINIKSFDASLLRMAKLLPCNENNDSFAIYDINI